MTADQILAKHEDANEYHFHQSDREWIIQAMEEYAELKKNDTECEHPWASVIGDGDMKPARCLKCGKVLTI